MPKISVIMPVFNGEKYLSQAIESVLAQEDCDIELIVVDDGSTDNTPEIVKSYLLREEKIRYIVRHNSGRPSFPKNEGINAARGEYICFLDHDDLYDTNRTFQLVEGLDNHPEWVAAFHDLRLIASDGSCFPGTYLSIPHFFENSEPYVRFLENDWFECNEFFFANFSSFTSHYIWALFIRNPL